HVGMVRLKYIAVTDAAEENAGPADPMTLRDRLLNQRRGLAAPLPPNDVIAGPDDSGKVEVSYRNFLRHRCVRRRVGLQNRINACDSARRSIFIETDF